MQSGIQIKAIHTVLYDDDLWKDPHMIDFERTLKQWAANFPNVKQKYYKASYCGLFWVKWPEDVQKKNNYETQGGIGLGTKNYLTGKVFYIENFLRP